MGEATIEVLRCPSCGYAEIVDDASEFSPRELSDDWCGHDRGRFYRETYVRQEANVGA